MEFSYFLFAFSTIFIIVTVPFIIILLLLFILSKKFSLSFRLLGFYKISDLKFEFESESIKLTLFVENLQLKLIWFRLRLLISGVSSLIELVDSPKRKKTFEITNKKKFKPDHSFDFVSDDNTEEDFDKSYLDKEEDDQTEFNKIKEHFCHLIKEKFGRIENREKLRIINDSNGLSLDALFPASLKKISKLERVLRNVIVFFDLEISRVNAIFKFRDAGVFHEACLGKILFGVVKGDNKKNELDVVAVAYELRVNQYSSFHLDFKDQTTSNFSYQLKDDEFFFSNLIDIQRIVLKGKLENGLINNNNSKTEGKSKSKHSFAFLNTITISVEISKVKVNISTFALKKIFKLVENIIRFNVINETKKSDTEAASTIPIEQFILSKIQSKLKTIKIKIEDLDISILSDNHLFHLLNIKSNFFTFCIKNSFNNYFDKSRAKLISTLIEIKLQDVSLNSHLNGKKSVNIANIPQFSIGITDDIIYDYQLKKCEIISQIQSDLSEVDVTLSTKDLDKVLEIVMCLVNGIEKIEKADEEDANVGITPKVQSHVDRSSLRFNFSKLNLVLYSEKLMAEINDISFEIEINKEKRLRNNIMINFSPLLLTFTNINKRKPDKTDGSLHNFSSYFVSSVIIQEFKLEIDEGYKRFSNIGIVFTGVDLIIYDDHLIDIIEFVSSFLTPILEDAFTSKFKRRTFKKAARAYKKSIKLIFSDVKIVKYLDYDDIISGKFKEMTLVVDDYMEIPQVKFYHQTNLARPHNHFLQNKTKIIDIINFRIKFNEDTKSNFSSIDLLFSEIILNSYCLEMACAISKISTFYIFFPEWILYHFTGRIGVDRITGENKYLVKRKKNDKVTILFEHIKVEINDYIISSVGILHVNQELENLPDKQIIQLLKQSKQNLLTVLIKNFIINVDDSKDTKFDCDYRKMQVELKIKEIEVLNETNVLLLLRDFKIIVKDNIIDSNFNRSKEMINSIISHKHHVLSSKHIHFERTVQAQTTLFVENLAVNFDDVKVFDQTVHLLFKQMKTFNEFPFKNYVVNVYSDSKVKLSSRLNLHLYNLEGGINSIDPVTKVIYNKLVLKIIFLCVTKELNLEKSVNTAEMSVHFFSFGFDPSQKTGFPLVIIPLLEANLTTDNSMNNLRINVPAMVNKSEVNSAFVSLYSDTYESELHNLLMKTKSITLFLNFKYLSTFVKIFEIFWEKTKFLRKSFSNANTYPINNNNVVTKKRSSDSLSSNIAISDKKITCAVFDLKIVYLLEYKEDYSTTFKFHPDIISKGYFGYIIRLYSFSLKYKLKSKKQSDSLKFNSNLFTVSFLSEENFNDDIFFKHDREISLLNSNLKKTEVFNNFNELPSDNKGKLINKNMLDYFANIMNSRTEIISNNVLIDLMFDYKHTLFKISDLSFRRKFQINNNVESIAVILDNLKVTWSKFNKDVLQLLIFDDVLLIVDKIILKLKVEENLSLNNTNSPTSTEAKVILPDLGEFNFEFELNNPQIVVQNELKKSTLLLRNKEPCKVIISKLCLNENSKDFKLDVIYDKLCLYIAPNYMESNNANIIYWIGDSNESEYYLEESLFKNILEAPKIRFKIAQTVKSKEDDEFDYFSDMNIAVDKIYCDMESAYFNDFMNVVEVFILDRGYSFAEEKNDIDAKKVDLQRYKPKELEALIKSNFAVRVKKTVLKEITFSLDKVQLNMSKGGKPMIQLLLIQFEGQHLIYPDKGSDTRINVRDLQIKNIESNRNEMLLEPLNYDNLGEFEDKMNILIFRKKDSYVNIGTDSQWYTLDYFELSLRPLRITISKAQIEFIIDFFFLDDSHGPDEEEHRNLLMSTTRYREKTLAKKEENSSVDKAKSEKKNAESYPIYFKQVKVNDTVLLLNFEYGEASSFNLNNAKIKFGHFDKCEKFYPAKILLERFVSHCKKQCFKNISSIISSLFGQGSQIGNKPNNEDEEKHRKLLLGNK